MKRFLIVTLLCIAGYQASAMPSGPSSPKKPSGQGKQCMMKCLGPEKCFTQAELMGKINSVTPECRQCVASKCDGTVNVRNLGKMLDCLAVARENCSACESLSAGDLARIEGCKTCRSGCKPAPAMMETDDLDEDESDEDDSPSPQAPSANLDKYIGCYDSCVANETCPSLDSIKMKLSMESADCQKCVGEACGLPENSNMTLISGCIVMSRQDCYQCAPISTDEQTKNKACQACLVSCVGSNVPPEMPQDKDATKQVPPKKINDTELMKGIRSCVMNPPVCPTCITPYDMFRKFNSATRPCRRCLMKQCVNSFGDEAFPDCVWDAYWDCAACSPVSILEQTNMKECMRCHQKCDMFKDYMDHYALQYGPARVMSQKGRKGGFMGRYPMIGSAMGGSQMPGSPMGGSQMSGSPMGGSSM